MRLKRFAVCFPAVFSRFTSMADNINGISGAFVTFAPIRTVVDLT